MLIGPVAGSALAAVLLVFLLWRYARLPGWPLLLLVVALVLGLVRVWSRNGTGDDPDHLVRAELVSPAGGSKTLIVLVHGLGGPTTLDEVRAALALPKQTDWSQLDVTPEGGAPRAPDTNAADILAVDYGDLLRSVPSNTAAADVARGVSRQIQKAVTGRPYERIVVVGFSMGALIARAAYLDASDKPVGDGRAEPRAWAGKVCRFVLLAGMNRGWDFSGRKPSDMNPVKYALYRAGANAGRWADAGRLYLATESGSPFVAGVRLQWMTLARERGAAMPGTVQLLGDIDDFVTDADNKDLRVASASRFAWLRVRGTGHANIVELGGGAPPESDEGRLGKYRADKITQAVTHPFAELRAATEEQPFQVDPDVTRVVFVVHGIRDLGEWSSGFEVDLQTAFRGRQAAVAAAVGPAAAAAPTPGAAPGAPAADVSGPSAKLVIASPRYGYLHMGPFLIPSVRQKFVRWFMDEYTETLARYPAVRAVDAIGHSNGTYLLTGALERYPAMKLDRVVLGNAVVRRDYPWDERVAARQVTAVRNYVTADDWVVALFPRFFEQRPASRFGNDLGGAGSTGFDRGAGNGVTNVRTVRGSHGALHAESVSKRRADIVAFQLEGRTTTSETLGGRDAGLDVLSDNSPGVWAGIAYLLVLFGYAAVLVSAGFWLRLTGRPWTWLAPCDCWRWWWLVGTLRLLGALVCLILVVAYFFTARESVLFVLVVALPAGWAVHRVLPQAVVSRVAVPGWLKSLTVMPWVLAVGLGVSFLAGELTGLTVLGWLVLAALAVVPVAVWLVRFLLILPPPGAGWFGFCLRLAARIVAALIAGFLAVVDGQEFALLVGVFVLGDVLVRLAGGPLAEARGMYEKLGPAKAPQGGALGWLLNALGLMAAPVYFAGAGYVLLGV